MNEILVKETYQYPDWCFDFVKKFSRFKEIQSLKKDKFHGSLTLNFADWTPHAYELKVCRRAEKS